MPRVNTRMPNVSPATKRHITATSRPRGLALGPMALVIQLALASALGVGIAVPQAYAQTAAASVRHYDIPAGLLQTVLNRFSADAGIFLAGASDLVKEKNSPGLKGEFTIDRAFEVLLSGTGLQAMPLSNGGYGLRESANANRSDAAALPLVSISAQRDAVAANGLPPVFSGGQVARGSRLGVLGNKDVMDTPFNTVSYTSELILDQQARTITDVLANNPSVRSIYPENDATTDLFVRGNKISALDMAYDGLYGIGYVGLDSLERVEFLTGANALLNGLGPIGGAGGMVSQVPKKAGDEPLTRLTANYISAAQLGGQLDIGRRFGEQKQFGIRLNVSYLNGPTNVRAQSKDVESIVVALDYRDSKLRLNSNFGYRYNQTNAPARTTYVATGFQLPAAPSNPADSWQQPWSYDTTESKFATARGEYDITPNVTVYAALGGSLFKERQFFANTQLRSSAGAIVYQQVFWPVYRNSVSAEAGVRGTFTAGPIKNSWSLSASALSNTSGNVQNATTTLYPSNIYAPVYSTPVNVSGFADAGRIPKTGSSDLSGMALTDTLGFLDDKIQWTVGVRQQNVNAKSYSATTLAQTAVYDKSATTYATGLVIKPLENMSVYGNYIEGLQQGPTATSGNNIGQIFAPYLSKQYEAGIKYDFGGFLTTASVYQLSTPNGQLNASTNIYNVDGEQRTRGLELNTFGEIARGVRLLGGVAFADSVQTHTANGSNDGKKVTGASDVALNLGAEWDPHILQGLTLSGRAIYTSKQYVDNANLQPIPSWVRYDVGARYKTSFSGHPTTLRFGIQNLFNKGYWSEAYQTYLIMGLPRTFMLSATVDL